MKIDLSNMYLALREASIAKDWQTIEDYFNKSKQAEWLGFRVDYQDPKKPVVWIDEVQTHHLGGWGQEAVSGIVSAGLVDLAIGLLGFAYLEEGMSATSQLNISLARPLFARKVRAEATFTGRTGRRIFGQCQIFDDQDKLCVYGSGIVTLKQLIT